tara:strand:- start:1433 stop:1582 length:150 start_codon:yes stop_codon:yes gene_type:complete
MLNIVELCNSKAIPIAKKPSFSAVLAMQLLQVLYLEKFLYLQPNSSWHS